MLGEWFNTIALFFLILEYTGSEFLLGVLFTVRMLSFALLQPIIGLLADRFNRKNAHGSFKLSTECACIGIFVG